MRGIAGINRKAWEIAMGTKKYGEDLEATTEPGTEAETVRDLAFCASLPNVTPADPAYVVVPEAHKIESLEAMAPRPYRARADVHVVDVAGFVAYVERFRQDATAAIFASDKSIVGVLNFRTPESEVAGHGDDTVRLVYQRTPEWAAWVGVDNRPMTHTDFAVWLEDHVDDVIEPAGAAIVEIAREFQVKRDTQFRSSIRLQSGATQIAYSETDAAQPGVLELPEVIALGLRPFEGSPAYRVKARIRYKLDAGKLTLRFVLHRPDQIERTEREAREAAILEALGSSVPVYRGTVHGINGRAW